MATITKDKEQRKHEAMAFKSKAYQDLAALIAGGQIDLQQGLQLRQAIQGCRSREDAEGIWILLQTWIQTKTRRV